MIRLFALLLLLWPGTLRAEIVSIRSGEHARFSRLVLTIPVGTVWRLGRGDDGYRLQLDEGVTGIDTGGAFERIPRDRIAELSTATPRDLSIILACDPCHADAFLWRPDRLVLDIVDGPPDPASAFEAPLDTLDGLTRMQPLPAGQSILPILFDPSLAEDPGALAPSLPEPRVIRPSPEVTAPVPVPSSPPEALSDAVSEAEKALFETLSRAATQGIVDLAEPLIEQSAPSPEPPTAPTRPENPDPVAPTVTAAGPGMTLRTGLDVLTGPREQSASCPDPALFALADWADPDAGFAEQIGARRLALTTESGRIDSEALESLARGYLHFGFGREARVALAQDGQRSAGRMVLDQIARILDDETLSGPPSWSAAGCADGAILWYALGQGGLDGLTPEDRRAAVRGFQALPNHLRAQLGARFASILAAGGDPDTAEAILNGADLALADPLPEQSIAAARIAIGQDDPEAAIRHLMSTTGPEARQTPGAIRDLIRLQLAQGGEVPDAILDLAGALRFEHRGLPVATELALVEVEALIAAGRTGQALDLIATAGEFAPPAREEDRLRLRSAAVSRMVGDGTDEAFLDLAFGDLPLAVDAATQNLIADRLIDLGFAERAALLLRGPAIGEEMAERRYLRAEAALMLDDPAGVHATLGGLDTDRARALRSAAGPADPVVAPVARTSDLGAENAAWRSAAWAELETAEDPLLRQAATAVLTPAPGLAGAAPLAERQAVLDEAAATRALVTDLLTRFTVEAD